MTKPITIVCSIGTRPEAIKMAPVVLALNADPAFDIKVLATAQHRDLLDQVLDIFAIEPDHDLDIMQANQGLPELTARLMTGLDKVLGEVKPDMVIAQGDTTTVLVTALASFYRRIPFAHVEAGLRTGDMASPFPEEMNRVLAGHISALHFAPTTSSRDNLLREGIAADRIHVTGNTVIDALLDVAARDPDPGLDLDPDKRLILVTAHRRENFGKPFAQVCEALRAIADANDDVQLVYPVHPNPNVHDVAHRELGDHPRILLTQPVDYGPFVALMKRAYLLLTDSGGVQEEAPALGKPVLVLRAETERPEAVDAGVVKLLGTDKHAIITETQRLLDDPVAYAAMAKGVSPYGDGQAAARIREILRHWFGIGPTV
jgi:UDP-N-acetylglucosamine 2-epimerase (non-hydrolysing)